MNVLILGATGFIGGHITKAALAEGWEVHGLRRTPGFIGHLAAEDSIEWHLGDLKNESSLRDAMRGIELVFHAAAHYPKRTQKLSVKEHVEFAEREVASVLAAASATKVQRLVYTSTLTTIGLPPPGSGRLADERDVYQPGDLPGSAYAEAKAAMERAVLEKQDELDVVVTNPTAVFGPGDVHLTLGRLLIAVARGYAKAWLPVEVNVVDVRDVAAAHISAAKHGITGQRYILGGHNMSLRKSLLIAARAAGVTPPKFKIPLGLINALAWLGDRLPFLPLPTNHLHGVRHWQGYNTAVAERQLGLKARPFEDTVRDALDWFRQNGYLQKEKA